MIRPGIADRVLGDLHRIAVSFLGIDLDTDLLPQNLQLVDGRRTIDVPRHEQHLPSFLAFDQIGQLTRKSRLTGTLQTGDQHDGRTSFQTDVGHRAAHQRRQLVADDLSHHLAGLDRAEHVLPERLGLHLVGERLGHLVVHVGVDQRAADLLQALGHIDLGDSALTLEDFERPFELVRQIFKHILLRIIGLRTPALQKRVAKTTRQRLSKLSFPETAAARHAARREAAYKNTN